MTNPIFKALTPPGLSVRVFWGFQAAFWGAVFLWRAVYNYLSGYGLSMAFERSLSLLVAVFLTAGLAHLLVKTILKRAYPLNVLLVAVVTVASAGLHILIDRLIFALAHGREDMSQWFYIRAGEMFYMHGWIFLCWVSLFWGLVQYFKVREAERVAVAAEVPVPVEPAPDPLVRDAYFWVKHQNRQVRVSTGDIEAVEAVRDYVELHTPMKSHLMRGKISEVEQRLDPKQFIRVHRSFIVNLGQVEALKTGQSGGRLVVMNSGREVRVGRTYLPSVRAKLDH